MQISIDFPHKMSVCHQDTLLLELRALGTFREVDAIYDLLYCSSHERGWVNKQLQINKSYSTTACIALCVVLIWTQKVCFGMQKNDPLEVYHISQNCNKNWYILVRFVCWAGHRWVECFCQRRSVSSFVLSETLRSAAQCVSVGTQVRTHTTKHIMRCHSPKLPCQASFLQRHCVLRYRFHYLVFLVL